MGRIGQAVQRPLEHPPGKGQCTDDLPGILHEIAVDRGRTPAAVFEVVHFYGSRVHPIAAVQLFPGVFLEEHDVRGHIGQRVLPKGVFGQTDGSQEVGALCDMFTRRGIDGIHEIAADHKGRDAAFPQQADGFGEKVVVDREFPQFREVRVIQRLLAERGIADYGVYAAGTEPTVLEADVEMLFFGVEILSDGCGCGVKLYSEKLRIEVFRAKADEIADACRRFQDVERFVCADADPGKSLIDTPDNGFRSIMRILGGTAGGRIVVRGKQALQFPVFSGPLLIFRIKSLREPAPSHIADENFLLFRRG